MSYAASLNLSRADVTRIRRKAIRTIAARLFCDQPLSAQYLQREVFTETGHHASLSTIANDMRAIADASPEKYSIRRNCLIRN